MVADNAITQLQPVTACYILNWKNSRATINCIQSILSSSAIPSYIYIIDNYSEDESLREIFKSLKIKLSKEKFSLFIERAIWIQTLENNGYAAGNNIALEDAIKNTTTEYHWIVNNDITVSNNCLDKMLFVMKGKDNVGFVGTAILKNDGQQLHCIGGGKLIAPLGIAILNDKNKLFTDVTEIGNLNYIMGCNLLVKGDVIDSIGLMSESYFMYSEEVEWQYRAFKVGWKTALAAEVTVRHWIGSDSRNAEYYYYKNRASLLFVKRNFNHFWLILSMIVHIILVIVTAVSWPKLVLAIRGIADGVKGITGRRIL